MRFLIRLLTPPPPSHPAAQSDPSNMSAERFRIFRAEKTYCVNAGKWYFELEVRCMVTDGIALKYISCW